MIIGNFICSRKVRMSHICKVEVSHFPVEAGLECGRGIGDHERVRVEPLRSVAKSMTDS